MFNANLESNWKNTVSCNVTLDVNVAPHKKTWLEFNPKVRYISGYSQKYFIPRGPGSKKPIVVESKSVYTTSPQKISVNLQGRSIDGAYIWKEANI